MQIAMTFVIADFRHPVVGGILVGNLLLRGIGSERFSVSSPNVTKVIVFCFSLR